MVHTWGDQLACDAKFFESRFNSLRKFVVQNPKSKTLVEILFCDSDKDFLGFSLGLEACFIFIGQIQM